MARSAMLGMTDVLSYNDGANNQLEFSVIFAWDKGITTQNIEHPC